MAPRRSVPEFVRALPPYLGGKRRLAPLIFALLAEILPRSEWQGARMLDPMCGGGAVALTAKALGFEVLASDASVIGQVVARSLITNSIIRLQRHHLLPLVTGELSANGPAQQFVPNVFTAEQAAWLDRAVAAAQHLGDPTRALLELVVIRTALRVQPLSTLDASDARHVADGDFDRISPRRLGHYLRADRALALPALERLARDINESARVTEVPGDQEHPVKPTWPGADGRGRRVDSHRPGHVTSSSLSRRSRRKRNDATASGAEMLSWLTSAERGVLTGAPHDGSF